MTREEVVEGLRLPPLALPIEVQLPAHGEHHQTVLRSSAAS